VTPYMSSRSSSIRLLIGEEILNYFDYCITNRFVEGKNNRIKTIKRMAYGYRNMDNFRMRVLVTNPGYGDRVSHLLT